MTNTNNKGFSTVVVMLILGVVGVIIVGSFAITSVINAKIVINNTYAHLAYQTAEAGAERVLAEWTIDPNPVSGVLYTDVPFITDGEELGQYTVSINDDGNGEWTVYSKGKSSYASRAVEVRVSVGLGGPNSAFRKAIYVNSDLDFSVASGTQIWGDVYVNGVMTWNNGQVQATDGSGTQFGYNPTAVEAPYGVLKYYYNDPSDTWQVVEAPTATNAGDAHGFWTSSQGIVRNNVWLNTTHNIGDSSNPAHPSSNQYWDRDGGGSESLNTSSAQLFGEYTGIAVRTDQAPEPFPIIGNGSYSNFAGFYNSNAPQSALYNNLTIYESGSLSPIQLANGFNTAIIGNTPNANGYPAQFIWNGTAVRDDSTVYSGPLIFEENAVVYVDGSIEINNEMGGDDLLLIASNDLTVDTNSIPATSFNLLAYDEITIDTSATLNGIYYATNQINMDSNPHIFGGVVTSNFNYTGGNTQITYVEDHVLQVGKWLPESAIPTVNLISWKEVAP